MPDFTDKTDGELLELLAAIEADPGTYVSSARADVLAVLALRYPNATPAEIASILADREHREDLRDGWVREYARALLSGAAYPPSSAPDGAAAREALRLATSGTLSKLLVELLFVLSIPAAVLLGIVQLIAPECFLMTLFEHARRLPYIRYVAGIPAAMALLLALPFAFLAPSAALAITLAFFGVLMLAAIGHLRRRFRVRARLRAFAVAEALPPEGNVHTPIRPE